MSLAVGNSKKPCGISYSDKCDFYFPNPAVVSHWTLDGGPPALQCDKDNTMWCAWWWRRSHPCTPPNAAVTCPLRLALLLTCPHTPSHTLLTLHAIAIAVAVVRPLALTVARPHMPSLLPSPLHALAHPPHFASCHHHRCMPLHTLLPSHTLTLTLTHPPTLHAIAIAITLTHLPLHALSPSHTITLACPLTLAISRPGPCWDWPPGSHRVKQVEARGIEAELDCRRVCRLSQMQWNVLQERWECAWRQNKPTKLTYQARRSNQRTGRVWSCEGWLEMQKAVNGSGYDGEHTRSQEDECVIETNVHHRDTGPGGQLGKWGRLGDVEDDWKRWSDAECNKTSGGRCGKDAATSGAHHDLNQVGMTSLADAETDQHGQRKRTKGDVPRPSTRPKDDPRRPTKAVNPLCRCGRLKRWSRRVSNPGRPTRSHRHVKAILGGLDVLYMMYMDWRWW